MKEYPNCTWASLPANVKHAAGDRVNAGLINEGISSVGEDILRWRMANTIRDLKRVSNKSFDDMAVCLLWQLDQHPQ